MPRRTELLFLGTNGGPPLRVDRSEPSTLLIVDGRPYLIDCGIATMRRMLAAHVASENVRTIFFTHLHADHDLGLADSMGNDFFSLNTAGSVQTIDIYGPPQTKDLVDAGFRYITFGFTAFAAEPGAIRAGLVNGQLNNPFVAHEIQRDGLVYHDETIRVTAAENTHYARMPAQSRAQLKSYSYRIETPHGVIVFTGDTGPSEAVTHLSNGADVLVSEVQDLGQVKKFAVCQFQQVCAAPSRRAGLSRAGARAAPGSLRRGIRTGEAGADSPDLSRTPATVPGYCSACRIDMVAATGSSMVDQFFDHTANCSNS